MKVFVEKLWRRMHYRGCDTDVLVKMIMINDDIVGRVVCSGIDQYVAETLRTNGFYSKAGIYVSFDAAVERMKNVRA